MLRVVLCIERRHMYKRHGTQQWTTQPTSTSIYYVVLRTNNVYYLEYWNASIDSLQDMAFKILELW